MRFLTITLYFVLAIVILASVGVSIPLIYDIINDDVNLIKNLNQNLTTYFIAILVTASLDLILRLSDSRKSHKKLSILFISLVNLVIVGLNGYVLYQNGKGHLNSTSTITIMGIIIAYIMWWIANYNNSAFDTNPDSALGGNTDKSLSNGH